MYDDPMREQMRQAHRLARLQALTGQAIGGGMPGMPAFPGMAQSATSTPAHQPFDFARNLTSSLGGTAGWVGGAHLAGKIIGSLPHPAAKVAGWAIPTVAMLAGSSALPAAVDAVSPSIHDSMNTGFSKAGPAGLLGAAALAGYMAYRNRKAPVPSDFSMRTPVTPQSVGVRAFLPHHADVSSPPNTMVGRARTGAPFSGAERVIVPSAPAPAPTMQQAAANVMTDIVKDPLMASQPLPMAASLAQHVAPAMWREPSKAVQGYTRNPVTHLPAPIGQVVSPDAFAQDLARRRAVELASTPHPIQGTFPPEAGRFLNNLGGGEHNFEQFPHGTPFKPIDHDLMAGHIVPDSEVPRLVAPMLRDSGAVVSHVGPRTPFSSRFSDNAIDYYMPKGQPTGADSYNRIIAKNNAGDGTYKPIIKSGFPKLRKKPGDSVKKK